MPINIERPRSALLRGVQITEFKGHIINPDPIIVQETDLLLEEFLSPTKLKALTGVNDLNDVEFLEMIVDTSETSLGNFGIYLPKLKQLKLNGSHVPRIRDLGTSLVHLKVLWLSRSGLADLDGIPTLQNLEELYLAYNEITDLSPCSLLENLKCLDVEGNLIDDIKQVEFLNLCPKLENLTICGNPICSKPSPDVPENDPLYSYRHEIIKNLPSLRILDDELTLNTKPINQKHRENNDSKCLDQCPFDEDWQMINTWIEEGLCPPEQNLAINESLRPSSSSSNGSRASFGIRPLSAMRPLSSYRVKTAMRPSSRLTNSSGFSRPSSRQTIAEQIRPCSDPVGDTATNDASTLTFGPTLQGNPLRALMARRKNKSQHEINDNQNIIKENLKINADKHDKKYEKEQMRSIELENKELREEISKWKKDHAKLMQERKKYFEPQVLKIDDEQPISLSDNDEIIDDEFDECHEAINETFSSLSLKDIHHKSEKDSEQFNMTRPKSAFKQSFDYSNEHKRLRDKKSNTAKIKPNPKVNSASNLSNSEQIFEKNESISRVTTGDTGYDSLNSSLSNSSINRNESDEIKKNLINIHQPKIISTSMSILKSSPNSSSLQNSNIKPSLKQLKTNIAPLSGLKLPK